MMCRIKVYVVFVLVTIFTITICGCNDSDSNKERIVTTPYYNIYNVNVDSLIQEIIPLDSINGVVYVANVKCSKCIVEMYEYIKEVSKQQIEDSLYLAVSDTLLLNYLLQKEFGQEKSTIADFSIILLNDNYSVVQCNGYLVKHTEQVPFECKKYQSEYLYNLYNH